MAASRRVDWGTTGLMGFGWVLGAWGLSATAGEFWTSKRTVELKRRLAADLSLQIGATADCLAWGVGLGNGVYWLKPIGHLGFLVGGGLLLWNAVVAAVGKERGDPRFKLELLNIAWTTAIVAASILGLIGVSGGVVTGVFAVGAAIGLGAFVFDSRLKIGVVKG